MSAGPPDAVIWVALSPGERRDTLAARLAEAVSSPVIAGPDLAPDARIAVVIADEERRERLEAAGRQGDGLLQSVLLTTQTDAGRAADFVLPAHSDVDTVAAVVRAALGLRREAQTLQAEVAGRTSAIGTIERGEFRLRTLDEARNLATMLALVCPNSDLVALGLQELLINAVEHGNLEIDAATKQDLLIQGTWREEVERRLADARYRDRSVKVTFQRGERLIAFTIQDEGEGFDHEALAAKDRPGEGYRGRGIAMAKELSFSAIAYLGAGNLVEATILLDTDRET